MHVDPIIRHRNRTGNRIQPPFLDIPRRTLYIGKSRNRNQNEQKMRQPTIVIEGRNPISGTVRISGAKNCGIARTGRRGVEFGAVFVREYPSGRRYQGHLSSSAGNRRRRQLRRQPDPDPCRRMRRSRRPHRNRPNDPRIDPASGPAAGPERLRQGFFSRRLLDRRAEDQLSPRGPQTDGRPNRNRRGVHL